ncbi:MAG: glycosyltransferase family 4 protein [Thermoanaerobaculia bacterium]
MNVLMVLDYYKPNVSGLSLYVERLAGALARRGQAVTVLTHRHRPDLPREEREDGVRIVRAPVAARFGKALLSPAIVTAAARELEAADVFHLHAPLVPAVPLALLATRRRVPMIVTYHCDLRPPPGVIHRAVEAVARLSQNFALGRAARVVTYTEDYARNTESLRKRLERVTWVLPPVPDPPPARLSPEEVRRRYTIRGRPVILFLGRFAEEKGLPYLIDAFATVRRRFPEAALVLAGEKDTVPGETVGARLAPLLADPSSGIVATGLVPPEATVELFSVADVLVLPSINSTESFGLCQVEAMLCGVPSVASNLPGVRQPVRMTGMGEIAAIADAEDLARQLVKVLENPAAYRKERQAIRRAFDLDRTVSDYEEIYRRALGSDL